MKAMEVGQAALDGRGRFHVYGRCLRQVDDPIALPTSPRTQVGIFKVQKMPVIEQAYVIQHLSAHGHGCADDVFHLARFVILPIINFVLTEVPRHGPRSGDVASGMLNDSPTGIPQLAARDADGGVGHALCQRREAPVGQHHIGIEQKDDVRIQHCQGFVVAARESQITAGLEHLDVGKPVSNEPGGLIGRTVIDHHDPLRPIALGIQALQAGLKKRPAIPVQHTHIYRG